ncbi:AAA family ATPase [Chitinophaga rhizosphaerae]|uniref:AAA family ATPase n=1 Tax=Chitinophaga rhizosphaerae TaxID=1864947 RepID=UPI000F805E99|nr:AAA family ATPase [Chitinophaga rhizosphaerae]
MELLFCYIHSFQSLDKCQINFGGKFIFHYDHEKNRLSIKVNEEYIADFFSSSISNVSALVGKNGAGKSAILEAILYSLGNLEISLYTDVISVFYIGTTNEIVFHGSKGLPDITWDNELKQADVIHYSRNYDWEYHLVYFTNNLYDRFNPDRKHEGNTHNLSIRADLEQRSPSSSSGGEGLISGFLNREYYRIIKMLQAGIALGDSFPFPKYISVRHNGPVDPLLEDPESDQENSPRNQLLIAISNFYDEFFKEVSAPEKVFIAQIEKMILLDFVESAKHPQSAFAIPGDIDIIPKEPGNLLSLVMAQFGSPEHYEVALQSAIELFTGKGVSYFEPFVWIPLEVFVQEKLEDFLQKLRRIQIEGTRYLTFGFSFGASGQDQFSSGELALLSMLSRFYEISDQQAMTSKEQIRDNALIIIDEGELYLHPKWQKSLISVIIDALPKIFPEVNLQILLTSHSPFVLSDLPKHKVTFLKNGRTIDPSDSSLIEHAQTFAGNIHTLLSDTFFMDNDFMGLFAKRKIDRVIADLTSSAEVTAERKSDIKKIILSIGEPIVRRKLLEMYDIRFNLGLDERLARIEKKLGL